VSRHRSPRDRRARPSAGTHRSPASPLRRSGGIAALGGGVLALGMAAPTVAPAVAGLAGDLAPATTAGLALIDPGRATAAFDHVVGAAFTTGSPTESPTVRGSVEPVVALAGAPDPRAIAGDLVKAVRQQEQRVHDAEQARAETARKAEAAKQAVADCGLDTSGLGGVVATARAAANFLGCRFGEPTMYGVAGRSGASDHPSGHAVDFMVDRSTGDQLASCALQNKAALGITYVIWRQRINYGSGWQPMEDRGSPTANHMDHVHVSFGDGGGRTPVAC